MLNYAGDMVIGRIGLG